MKNFVGHLLKEGTSENTDKKIMNFLIRRIQIDDIDLYDEDKKKVKSEIEKLEKQEKTNEIEKKIEELKSELEFFEKWNGKMYSFKGHPGYGFNTFFTKKQMESAIINLLNEDTDLIDEDFYDLPYQNPKKALIIRTVRAFLKRIVK